MIFEINQSANLKKEIAYPPGDSDYGKGPGNVHHDFDIAFVPRRIFFDLHHIQDTQDYRNHIADNAPEIDEYGMLVQKSLPIVMWSHVRHGKRGQVGRNHHQKIGQQTNQAINDDVILKKKILQFHEDIIT